MKLSYFTIHNSKFATAAALYAQMEELAKLDEVIKANLDKLGFGSLKGEGGSLK